MDCDVILSRVTSLLRCSRKVTLRDHVIKVVLVNKDALSLLCSKKKKKPQTKPANEKTDISRSPHFSQNTVLSLLLAFSCASGGLVDDAIRVSDEHLTLSSNRISRSLYLYVCLLLLFFKITTGGYDSCQKIETNKVLLF